MLEGRVAVTSGLLEGSGLFCGVDDLTSEAGVVFGLCVTGRDTCGLSLDTAGRYVNCGFVGDCGAFDCVDCAG